MSSIPTMFNRAPDGGITGVTFLINGQPYMADQSIPTFSELLDELKKGNPDTDRLVALTTPAQAIVQAVEVAIAADYLTAGTVSVSTKEVRYNGEPVEGVLVERILQMLVEGFDIMPMVRFLENLYTNPATYARDELYLWLENSNLPITQDGHFLAYKMVGDNYRSRNNFLNLPGTTVSMPRQACDPVRDHLCSTGLHFCSKHYIGEGHRGKIVILKINPADVVSIPSDSGNSKGRAWKYEILGDFGGDAHTKQWPSVVGVDGVEAVELPANTSGPLEFPSDLSKALFAALTEIDVDTKSREDRLDFANECLVWSAAPTGREVEIDSFTELTQEEAGILIEKAREIKAEEDADAEAEVEDAEAEAADAAAHAKQVKIDAINSYGIVKLRQLTGKWKGVGVKELRRILIDRL